MWIFALSQRERVHTFFLLFKIERFPGKEKKKIGEIVLVEFCFGKIHFWMLFHEPEKGREMSISWQE